MFNVDCLCFDLRWASLWAPSWHFFESLTNWMKCMSKFIVSPKQTKIQIAVVQFYVHVWYTIISLLDKGASRKIKTAEVVHFHFSNFQINLANFQNSFCQLCTSKSNHNYESGLKWKFVMFSIILKKILPL